MTTRSKYFPPQVPVSPSITPVIEAWARRGERFGPQPIKPAGSSPALRITCPVCHAAPGVYCTKYEHHPTRGLQTRTQTIAHKRRREEEERTR